MHGLDGNKQWTEIAWPELWKAEPYRIKYLIQSVYDVLPSPFNLFYWGKTETPACFHTKINILNILNKLNLKYNKTRNCHIIMVEVKVVAALIQLNYIAA